ncbi:hypothetical protein Q1695_010391 [Nippostrongylus brasiliensis]|nr:hypothetical protein Q1695_010391 [Nippostrongylus brasiliensis]
MSHRRRRRDFVCLAAPSQPLRAVGQHQKVMALPITFWSSPAALKASEALRAVRGASESAWGARSAVIHEQQPAVACQPAVRSWPLSARHLLATYRFSLSSCVPRAAGFLTAVFEQFSSVFLLRIRPYSP